MAKSKKSKAPKGAAKNAPAVPKALHTGALPRPVGEVWAAGVGALAQARKTGADSFDALVSLGGAVLEKGGDAAKAAAGQVEGAASALAGTARDVAGGAVGTVQGGVEAVVEAALSRLGVPGREEVLALRAQVDALQARLADLAEGAAASASGAASAVRETVSETVSEAAEAVTETASDVGEAVADAAESASERVAEAVEDATGVAVYAVAKHADGWAVQRAGNERATSVHGTKKDALSAARETARSQAPSRLVVHKADGSVADEMKYEA